MSTTCTHCGRAVYLGDVDAAGRCVLCEPDPVPARPVEVEAGDEAAAGEDEGDDA